MSRPYDRPTPHHAVILAQTRIHTRPDASLDACLRRNDGLLVHCWLVGWCGCGHDMSRPYDCPTPYHPVILAQARIHTHSDAALDSRLRRNDGL